MDLKIPQNPRNILVAALRKRAVTLLKYLGLLVWASAFAWGLQGCDNIEPDPTREELLARRWQVSIASANGGSVPFGVDQFRLQLTIDRDGNPLGFTVTPGGLPPGARPTYNNGNSGTWSLQGNEIRFSDNSGISVCLITNLDEGTVSLQWNVPESLDKTAPTYTYTFVPAG